MTIAQFLWGWLVALGLVDIVLVAPALARAATVETVGRLVSTLGVLAGLVLASYGRIIQPRVNPSLVVIIGLIVIDAGLVGYTLYLPDRGLLDLIRKIRRPR